MDLSAVDSTISSREGSDCTCCTKIPLFSDDDFWYRAIVLEASDSDVKVLYADYGNVERLPFSRVQPITASHLQLPFRIIRCSLEGTQFCYL